MEMPRKNASVSECWSFLKKRLSHRGTILICIYLVSPNSTSSDHSRFGVTSSRWISACARPRRLYGTSDTGERIWRISQIG